MESMFEQVELIKSRSHCAFASMSNLAQTRNAPLSVERWDFGAQSNREE
jgi:hypothetical protein